MIELHRTTRDARHLELAQTVFEMRNLVMAGGDDNQDLVPFFEQREAVGHAVRANYLYDGASPYGSTRQSTITRVRQSHGQNYGLPPPCPPTPPCSVLNLCFVVTNSETGGHEVRNGGP